MGKCLVAALLEGHDYVHVAVGSTFRGQVAEAVEAAELVLDDLYYRVLRGLGRGAKVGDVDRRGGCGDGGVLADGHVHQRQRARQHDDDRQDPGEDPARQ